MEVATMREAWRKKGCGSVAVRGLKRARVVLAAGECPVLYYPAGWNDAEIQYIHGWAFPELYRLQFGEIAWLRALCDYTALYIATMPPDCIRDGEAAD
jgi:hypothetical protein